MEAAQAFISGLVEQISMPGTYRKVRLLLDNANAKISDFEMLIQADPLLAASTLKFANSGFFGFGYKVDGLGRAIDIIGFGQLHDLLLGCLCIRAFCDNPGNAVDFKDFWRKGIQRGIAARTIAQYYRLPANDRYFTIGLLLEIGHAAMLVKEPELTLKSLQESQRQNLPIVAIERKYFGFDYCQLGSALLRHWRLPLIYQQVIEGYLCPKQARPELRSETDIAYLAHHLCIPSIGLIHLESNLLHTDEQLRVRDLIFKAISGHLDEICAILNPPAP